MTFLARLVANAIAIWVATTVVPGLSIVARDGTGSVVLVTFLVALVFGLVNAIVRPVVNLLSMPLLVLTLGLFTLVVNGLRLALTAWISERTDVGLRIDNFGSAVLGAVVVSVVSFVVGLVLERAARHRSRSRR